MGIRNCIASLLRCRCHMRPCGCKNICRFLQKGYTKKSSQNWLLIHNIVQFYLFFVDKPHWRSLECQGFPPRLACSSSSTMFPLLFVEWIKSRFFSQNYNTCKDNTQDSITKRRLYPTGNSDSSLLITCAMGYVL